MGGVDQPQSAAAMAPQHAHAATNQQQDCWLVVRGGCGGGGAVVGVTWSVEVQCCTTMPANTPTLPPFFCESNDTRLPTAGTVSFSHMCGASSLLNCPVTCQTHAAPPSRRQYEWKYTRVPGGRRTARLRAKGWATQ
jgi:hypothetical protein